MTIRGVERASSLHRALVGLSVAGLLLALFGWSLQPRAVEVSVHPRRDPGQPYWRGRLAEPAVADGHFFLQKLENHYRSPPLPFPHRTPPYRVRFEMDLVADSQGRHRFELDSSWHGALDVDGRRVFGIGPFAPGRLSGGEIELSRGAHRAVLTVQPEADPDQPIRLLWKEPDATLRPVTSRDLRVRGAERLYVVQARFATPMVWLGGSMLALATFLWVSSSRGQSRKEIVVALAAVMGVGLLARAPHFDTYPRVNIDETHNAWVGFNLLHEGRPRSWSWLPVYTNERVSWFSYEYPIVETAFDHAPLLPVLAGVEATLLGADDMFDCVAPRIRPLMVIVGTVSVGLLFLLAREVAGFRAAFLAAILMAVSPLVAFNSRLLKEDGLVQLFVLLAVYLYLRARARGRDYPWAAALAAGLAAVSKAMGIAVGFALSSVAFAESPRRLGRPLFILATALLFAATYPLYGMALDRETFGRVMTYLSSSYSFESFFEKFLILPRMILQPRISAVTPLVDGWILLGWLSALRLSRERVVSVTFVCYLLVLMSSVRSENFWGFYLEPVFPFLCLGAAWTTLRALGRGDVMSTFLVIALGFLPQYAFLEGAPRPGGFRGVAFLAFLPLVPSVLRLEPGHPLRRSGQVLTAALVSLGILASLYRCMTTL